MAGSFLISIVVFSLLGVAAMAVYVALYGNRLLEERLNDLAIKIRTVQGTDLEAIDNDIDTLGRMLFQWASRKFPAPKSDTAAGEKLSRLLVQAGFVRSVDNQVFQVARVCSIAIGTTLGLAAAWFTHHPILIFIGAGAVVGYVGPSYYLARKGRTRQNEIAKQLSDVLDLLVVCVEAGLGMFEAIRIVGAETERQRQAIGRELSMVSGEIAAGASLGQALRGLADRTAVEDIKPLAATLIQSEQLGAQMAPALRASSDALRTRRRLRAEEAAQKTTVKILFPLVLFVLPAMIMIIVGPAIIQILGTLSH
ncbi:MAG TPA: type II secretion system F family protein [Candidatus Binataceae bacterium]|nr:type II secretion system F family protein [Candidatus Binataceae bacterium]